MKSNEFQKKINKIQEKIGEESASLVLDEIGVLMTDNKAMNDLIDSKDNEIADLKKRNENLMNVNANLLMQVPMGNEEDLEPEKSKKEEYKPYNFKESFDEFGNFKS